LLPTLKALASESEKDRSTVELLLTCKQSVKSPPFGRLSMLVTRTFWIEEGIDQGILADLALKLVS
jgi:hypothetical protein